MLDPQAASVLEELAARAKPMPADEADWLQGYREELEDVVAMQGPAPEVAVSEAVMPGAAPRKLRWFMPAGEGALPTVLFLHGGGFVAGSLEAYEIPLRHLPLRSGWQVAAPDYRLAPEHPYPAAPDDCEAALRYLGGGAEGRVDPARIVVMGDSAGGLLAAVTALRAKRTGLPLRRQVLLYPNVDLHEHEGHASRGEHDGTVIRLDELYRGLALYVGSADRADPDVSPLHATDLAGVCPATIITCEHDPLRDEGERYAQRLREAGVAVEAERLPGQVHSVLQRGGRIAAGDALISRLAAILKAVDR